MSKQALVLTAFGTSTKARDTYEYCEKRLRERFPGQDIFWAFSSSMLRAKMSAENLHWNSPGQVLKQLGQQGYTRAAVQSLHVVPGIEFDKVQSVDIPAGLAVAVGRPLLDCEADCRRVLDALAVRIPGPSDAFTVLAGHGTPHSGANDMYRLFERCLEERCGTQVCLAMVEGMPSWEQALAKIRRSGLQAVSIVPLMFVAGEHIMNDVLGDRDGSWKSSLSGFRVDGSAGGLGLNDNILTIYADHIEAALQQL